MRRKQQHGFTLLEVTVAIFILGVIAMIGVPMFMKDVAKGKSTEAAMHLESIHKAAKLYFNEHGRFPQGTAQVLPGPDGDACSHTGRVFDATTAWNTDARWSALDFAPTNRGKFSYHYEATSLKSARAWAVADLSCNGKPIVYELILEGRANGSVDAALIDPFSSTPPRIPVAEADTDTGAGPSEDPETTTGGTTTTAAADGSTTTSSGGASTGGGSTTTTSTDTGSTGGSTAGGTTTTTTCVNGATGNGDCKDNNGKNHGE